MEAAEREEAGCWLASAATPIPLEHFGFLRLGVLTARRGWAAAEVVMNPLLFPPG
jgi:hypothetical protein